jgi:hypothetical protein
MDDEVTKEDVLARIKGHLLLREFAEWCVEG